MKKLLGGMAAMSVAVAAMMTADYARSEIRGGNVNLADLIFYKILSHTPRQSSPISPSRRFRSQDEANQRKESAALKRERRAVKRYSQYCSTFKAFYDADDAGYLTNPLSQWSKFCAKVCNDYIGYCFAKLGGSHA